MFYSEAIYRADFLGYEADYSILGWFFRACERFLCRGISFPIHRHAWSVINKRPCIGSSIFTYIHVVYA